MPLKIKLKPMGRIDKRFYRIVVAEARSKRDGKVIDTLGYFNPVGKTNKAKIDKTKVDKWINQGALMTPTVKKLITS